MKEAPAVGRLGRARGRLVAIRFGILVAMISFAIAATMIAAPIVRRPVLLQVVITIPLVVGIYVATGNLRLVVIAALVFTATAVVGRFFLLHRENPLLIADMGLRASIFGLLVAWAAREVLREEEVSLDTIMGGICIYLLVGFLFAHLFLMIVLAEPSAIVSRGHPLSVATEGPRAFQAVPAVIYFSFTTMTTVGFGDLTPVSGLARLVAIVEGTVGQLFPAIFIARLVSLHVARGQARRGKD